MTVSLNLPPDLEQRLQAEVRAGRHGSLEEVILEKLSRCEEADLPSIAGVDANHLRQDLDNAWNDRKGAMNGEDFFGHIATKSAAIKAQGQ